MKQSLFTILTMTALLWSCADNQQKTTIEQEYPRIVKDSNWIDLYTKVKWGYYKYYQNCEVDAVDTDVSWYNHNTGRYEGDLTYYSKPFFCHEVYFSVYYRRDYKFGFHFYVTDDWNYDKKNGLYMTAEQVDCVSHKITGSPLYGFYFDNTTKQITHLEYMENAFYNDKDFMNEVLNSPDDEFVAKLLAHQDCITPWLKTELILRGYLKQ